MRDARVVSVLIDQPPEHSYHRASVAAIRDAASSIGAAVEISLVQTDHIDSPDVLVRNSSAILIGPGSPYRDPDAVIACIRSARESGLPLVGT